MKQPFDAVVGDPRVVPLAPNALHLAPGAVPIDRRDEPGADFFHDGVMLELREVRAVPGLGVARDRQVLAPEREPDGPTDVQPAAVRWSLRLLAVNPVRCAWWRLPSRISRRCP